MDLYPALHGHMFIYAVLSMHTALLRMDSLVG